MTAKEMFLKLWQECCRATVICEYCKLYDDMEACAMRDCRTGWNMVSIAIDQMYSGEYH